MTCLDIHFPWRYFILHWQMAKNLPCDWLMWTCWLLSKLPMSCQSTLASPLSYSCQEKWKELHDWIPEHQTSSNNKSVMLNSITWKHLQCEFLVDCTISEHYKWGGPAETNRTNMHTFRINLISGERGLPFRRCSHFIWDPKKWFSENFRVNPQKIIFWTFCS
jgi:hypothetical protein